MSAVGKYYLNRKESSMKVPFRGAKSICTCGHLGDGENSDHEDSMAHGHGKCKVPGCDCHKFTWERFTDEFQEYLDKLRKEE